MALLSQRRYCLLSNSIGLRVKTTPHLHIEMKEEESFSAVTAGNSFELNSKSILYQPMGVHHASSNIVDCPVFSGRYSTSMGVFNC
jgi:hypothetical protein